MKNIIILLLIIIIVIIIICWGYFTKWKYADLKSVSKSASDLSSNFNQNIQNNDRLSFENLLKKIDKGLKPKTWGPPTWYTLFILF